MHQQLAKIGSGELPPDVWKRLGKSVQAASPGSLILSKGGSTSGENPYAHVCIGVCACAGRERGAWSRVRDFRICM